MNIRRDMGWDKYIRPFLYKELPGDVGWSAILGTLCALTFFIMVVTGMVLAFYYVPTPDKAWESVQFIDNQVTLGKIVRGLHHWGAGAMVLLAFCHLIVTYLHGSYAEPRQINWITGAMLFLVVLMLGFTGYLLPWDMKAYWATIVGANIPDQIPGIGNYITRIILGGENISGFTLTRFYSIHTLVLPACLLLFMAVHIYLIRIHNISDPRERLAGEMLPPPAGKLYRFYPEHTNRSAVGFGALFLALLLLSICVDPPMEQKAGTFISDYLPRPEWYYMWLFQLLTYFTGYWELIGTVFLFGGGLILLFGVPFFSESKLKGMINRPVSIAVAASFTLCIVYLTAMAYSEAAPYNKTVAVPSRTLTEREQRGLLTYVEQQCAYCHNILGEGGHRTGPDMSNIARKKRTPEYLIKYVENPKAQMASTTMPEYKLTAEQLRDLAAFLLALDFKGGDRPVRKSCADVLAQGHDSRGDWAAAQRP
ncbi:MAG: cytochrome b N-terminal domain-containing protein [Desulfovibrio sp.]|jgi:ubiquinol-cytochrome c reductase cytochrome b subunit|nr:cytochrome b N-terminal domain-containing protein [Desulfovibrio sp.]